MNESDNKPKSPMQFSATWDAVAKGYADESRKHAVKYSERALSIAPLTGTERVLDIATGPGTLALLAAERAAKVVAIDFSAGMIAQLAELSQQHGLSNVEGKVMDAQSLAFDDESFDATYCMFGCMFFPDRATAFREMRRVLRPGGTFVLGTWAPIDRRPLMKLGFDALAEAMPELPAMQKGDLQSVGECVQELSAVGFQNVRCEPFTASAQVESAEQYLTFMERGGAPFAALKKRLGDSAWQAVFERMRIAVRTRLPEGGASLAAEALLTSGVR